MTVTTPRSAATSTTGTRSSWGPARITAVVLATAALIAVGVAVTKVSSTGPTAARIRNPDVPMGTRAVEPLWGFDHWGLVIQFGALGAAVALWGYFIWRSVSLRSWQPGLTLCVALTTMVGLDPISNWVPYAAYDPSLVHWPTTWAWASISPTVEPLFVIPGYVACFLPAVLISLRLAARLTRRPGPPDRWVVRHPIATLFLVGCAFGMVWDTVLELFFIHTGFYTYTQVISFGSLQPGDVHQFPLLWEVPAVSILYGAGTVLLERDDRGQTVASRWAVRNRWLGRRPILGEIAVAAFVMNFAFALYCGFWACLRLSGIADTTTEIWPYQDTKVYDPQGYYEEAGVPGPYFPGIWSGKWP